MNFWTNFPKNIGNLQKWASEVVLWAKQMQGMQDPSTVMLPEYSKDNLPSKARGIILVPDATGGAVPAFGDGTNWRRVTDRTVIN